jgi:hypothetical protein
MRRAFALKPALGSILPPGPNTSVLDPRPAMFEAFSSFDSKDVLSNSKCPLFVASEMSGFS